MIHKTGEFNVSVLTEGSKFDTYKHFGFQSGKDIDKFESVEFLRAANGIAYIAKETNAYLSAKVVSETDLGTHTLFLADVTDGEVLSDDPSVTYAFYQKNIKQKPGAPKADETPAPHLGQNKSSSLSSRPQLMQKAIKCTPFKKIFFIIA